MNWWYSRATHNIDNISFTVAGNHASSFYKCIKPCVFPIDCCVCDCQYQYNGLSGMTVQNKSRNTALLPRSIKSCSWEKHVKVYENCTCTGETITGVSKITGAVKAIRYVGTSGMFTASSIVLSAFVQIYVLHVYHILNNQSLASPSSLFLPRCIECRAV